MVCHLLPFAKVGQYCWAQLCWKELQQIEKIEMRELFFWREIYKKHLEFHECIIGHIVHYLFWSYPQGDYNFMDGNKIPSWICICCFMQTLFHFRYWVIFFIILLRCDVLFGLQIQFLTFFLIGYTNVPLCFSHLNPFHNVEVLRYWLKIECQNSRIWFC